MAGSDLYVGTLDVLILKALSWGPDARLRHRPLDPPVHRRRPHHPGGRALSRAPPAAAQGMARGGVGDDRERSGSQVLQADARRATASSAPRYPAGNPIRARWVPRSKPRRPRLRPCAASSVSPVPRATSPATCAARSASTSKCVPRSSSTPACARRRPPGSRPCRRSVT